MTKKKIPVKRILIVLLCLMLLGSGALLAVNAWVMGTTAGQILEMSEAEKLSEVDCILVLGCYVWEDGTPSDMLEDRLKRAVELYQLGASPKLLMSGDHGTQDYNEVKAMRQYALDAQIPSQDIFMDHAGFSTYDSVYRAKEVFGADKIIIVTQEYHLYRALYVANALGIEAYGVSSDYRTYIGQLGRDIREVLARVKDFGMSAFRPEPTFLGEVIPVSGDGNVTNDEHTHAQPWERRAKKFLVAQNEQDIYYLYYEENDGCLTEVTQYGYYEQPLVMYDGNIYYALYGKLCAVDICGNSTGQIDTPGIYSGVLVGQDAAYFYGKDTDKEAFFRVDKDLQTFTLLPELPGNYDEFA